MGNTPNEWLFVCELFSIFVTSSVVMRSADILKVFSHCLYNEIWQFQKEKRQRMTLISCLDYGKGYVQCSHTPYLLKCGVLHRLFSLGFCQNLVVDKRNQLHTWTEAWFISIWYTVAIYYFLADLIPNSSQAYVLLRRTTKTIYSSVCRYFEDSNTENRFMLTLLIYV